MNKESENMDRKTIIDNLDQMEIGVDEPFQFSIMLQKHLVLNP